MYQYALASMNKEDGLLLHYSFDEGKGSRLPLNGVATFLNFTREDCLKYEVFRGSHVSYFSSVIF